VTTTKRLLGTKPKAQAGCKKTFEYQTQGPGRMAKMCQAGTVNSACRNPCYRCSMMSNHQGNHSMRCTFLTRLLPPPDIRELSEAPLSLFVVFFLGWRIPKLRWGWVFLKQTRILSRFQFTRYFIEFVFLETERFVSSNPNVDAANLRPALEQGCRKQTPSTNILFFHTNLLCVLDVRMYWRV